ncbi:hypothetical protein Bca52824_089262 [Brassica carinata]|uniref:Uncharacterized protein n=1 Tax=Brassica carinata TaxID=52824 RepID=A0A8X7PBS5_BRACI|nr:hypothetical protein Bca52824_089262 [Brassica carinata]
MDPNQTTGTTPSGVNDIDPIGPDSGAGMTPTGLTGANDATETAPTQRIPPIGTSSQDRSLPINQTSIPERAGARVWNRPGDRSSSDDLTRSQSRLISPTPLAQTRGELTELRGMMTTLIDEIRTPNCLALQRSQALDLDATREKIHNDPRRRRQGEPRTRISPPNHSIPENQTPSAMRTFHQAGHDLHGPVNIDPQRENLGIPSETETIQNYIEKNDAELKRIHAIVHMATSSAPDIDMVIEETRRTPFTNIIASISHPNEVVALAALKNGVWFSSKFREELAVRAPISLDDALHRASYFATHEEEIAALKEQYKLTTKGQHSYAINNSPQKSSTYDLSKYCAFHDRKGRSTEECRAALCNQNENKKTNEEAREEEEEPVTPKSHQKAKVPTNKRGREIEQESPSSPPPAPKKRVDMISWGQNSNTTDEIKSQTEGKIRFEISVAIRTLENPDEVTPLPVSLHTTQTQSLRT